MDLKRYLRRGMALILALLLVAGSLAGCGAKEENAEGESSAAQESIVPEESQTSEASAPETSEAVDSAAGTEETGYVPFYFSTGIDDNGFMTGITALNYVELCEYDGIKVPADQVAVSDAEIQAEIDKILSAYATTSQVMDRPVEDGDSVNIDYVGYLNGVPFDGGSTQGMGTTVIIGVTNYIPGFLDQLIGHEPGENFDINVTFPEDYHSAELAGQDAVFNITINYIDETSTPELTDEFVADFLTEEKYDISTVEELRAYVTSQLQEPKVRTYLNTYLAENCAFKAAPGSLITYMTNMMVDYYAYYADAYGMDLDSFVQQYVGAESMDALKEAYASDIVDDANATLLLQAIAEAEGITVTEEDVRSYFEDMTGSPDYSSYVEEYGLPYIMQAVLFTKVQDFVLEHAVIE